MAADGVGDGEKSPFRWLDAARYAVASMVAVLIVAVIVNAIKVVLRPEPLSFSVVRGSVFARRIQHPPTLVFDFNLRAGNPSGRARLYYVNIKAYLFDKNTSASSSKPEDDSFIYFNLPDIAVPQLAKVDSLAQVPGTRDIMTESFFDILYNNNTGATISGVTMRLDGILITEVTLNKTRPATYYCDPLFVGGDPDDEASQNIQDAHCRESQYRQYGY